MFRKPVREINAEYRAEDSSLPAIQILVKETCVNAGMSRKEINTVILAIEEGVTNIIRHAYLYAEQGVVRIRIVVYNKRIVFSLIDNGRSFQPEGDVKIDLEKLAESGRKGGLGFYMIRKIMDSVEYLSTPGFNELRMTKMIARHPGKTRLMMGRMFTLRVKFSLYTFLIMLIIIAGSHIFINNRTTANIHRQLHSMVRSLSLTVAEQAKGLITRRRSYNLYNEYITNYMDANPELKSMVIVNNENKIIGDNLGYANLRKVYEPPDNVDISAFGEPQIIDMNENLIYMVNGISDGPKHLGLVHIVYTGKMMDEMLNQERTKIIILTLIGLAFGIGGIYLLSDYFVSPIIRIVERVRRFSSGEIETELPLEGVEEFFEISKVLNEMMSRLRRDHKNIIERERVAKEIEVAGQIQKTLLPNKLPEIPQLKIDTFYRAASHISGDLYDVFRIDEDNYCLLVADVSGKGIPASLIMSVLRTVIRIQSKNKKSAHEILVAVNEYIEDDIPSNIFITIFLGIYNLKNSRFNFVSAGHNPLIYVNRRDSNIMEINPKGGPLGLPYPTRTTFAEKLKQQFIQIREGDVLFIYSDGITEAMNRTGSKYGMERLVSFFEEKVLPNNSCDTKNISDMVLADIDDYCGLATQADDITFITIAKCLANDDDNTIESTNMKE